METSVLIVEDEPAIQELIAYTCESSGMEVRRASNVAEARKMLEAKNPGHHSFRLDASRLLRIGMAQKKSAKASSTEEFR